MYISRVILKNWRNFAHADVELRERMFIVGPNESGKSNFLDVFRFLRDIARSGGGLEAAINERGGFSRIHSLFESKRSLLEIDVHLKDPLRKGDDPDWRYSIGINFRSRIAYERAWRRGVQVLNRPEIEDREDDIRLTQTHLEQISANSKFRDIAKFFSTIRYKHIVPQLLRHQFTNAGEELSGDPYGMKFLDRIAKTSEPIRNKRLARIEEILMSALPQVEKLSFDKKNGGEPHLSITFSHWRDKAKPARESQFSDGTLRLVGLFWSLLGGGSMLLLEEPELSLHTGIVAKLPALIYRLQRDKTRQVLITTHSAELLSDKSIGGESVLILKPRKEGTEVSLATSNKQIRNLLEAGLAVSDVVLPYTAPQNLERCQD